MTHDIATKDSNPTDNLNGEDDIIELTPSNYEREKQENSTTITPHATAAIVSETDKALQLFIVKLGKKEIDTITIWIPKSWVLSRILVTKKLWEIQFHDWVITKKKLTSKIEERREKLNKNE